MKAIGHDLTAFFKDRGITQETIAAQLGVTQQYISGLLSGKKPFGKKQAQRFSELWGISPSWLLLGEGEMLLSDEARAISHNSGIANNGDHAIINETPKDLTDTLKKSQAHIDELLAHNKEQISELLAQNKKSQEQIDRLLGIIETFTAKK